MSNEHYNVFRDGDAWCATGNGSINLRESDAGFGTTPQEAITDLIKIKEHRETLRHENIRHWECTACGKKFSKSCIPKCPHCAGGQLYVYEVEEGCL